jgi:membrane-bound lytic murein transglycosylase D
LSQLALRYDTSITALQKANNLTGTAIRVGGSLVIPEPPLAARATPARERSARRTASAERTRYHTVAQGDTAWRIAQRYGIDVSELLHRNGLSAKHTLHAGQRLALPGSGGAKRAQAEAATKPSPHSYTVQTGDSLWSIAQRFAVSVSDLRLWNALPRTDVLHPGQSLQLHLDVAQGTGG